MARRCQGLRTSSGTCCHLSLNFVYPKQFGLLVVQREDASNRVLLRMHLLRGSMAPCVSDAPWRGMPTSTNMPVAPLLKQKAWPCARSFSVLVLPSLIRSRLDPSDQLAALAQRQRFVQGHAGDEPPASPLDVAFGWSQTTQNVLIKNESGVRPIFNEPPNVSCQKCSSLLFRAAGNTEMRGQAFTPFRLIDWKGSLRYS